MPCLFKAAVSPSGELSAVRLPDSAGGSTDSDEAEHIILERIALNSSTRHHTTAAHDSR